MVFSSLQNFSLKRFFFAQVFSALLFTLSLFLLEERLSFFLGGVVGEIYFLFTLFLVLFALRGKKEGLVISLLILKWPVLALVLWEIFKFARPLPFVLGLSYVAFLLGASFYLGSRD